MADIVDPQTRSRMMAAIRGCNTKPETTLRKALHAMGLRYRLHRKDLPGRPDIVLPSRKAVIFVHGCFWHRHEGCRFASVPATRPDFWNEKFRTNVERDRRTLSALHNAGWRTAVVWECALKNDGADSASQRLAVWLEGTSSMLTIPEA